jgi:predicted N-acetyltransferase YhbS
MPSTRFLQNASCEQLLDAAALNHTVYFGQVAEVGGEDAFAFGTYDWSPHRWNEKEATVPYPRFNPSTVSQDVARFMVECRGQGVKVASVRTLGERAPADLAASLLAQGFRPAGPDPILALDLAKMDVGGDLDGLRMEIIEDEETWEGTAPRNLPNRRLRYQESLTDPTTRRSWHLVAWSGDRLIGHIQLLLTRGPLGVAGLYGLGVIPHKNDPGVEAALVRAACRHARNLGCGYAVYAVGECGHLDPALGFEAVGQGMSWWIQEPEIDTPPTPESVAFVEAVGWGDTDTLDRLPSSSLPSNLDEPLLCGLTPLQVAALLRQPASAEWLIQRGATPNLSLLWTLGWKDRLPAWLVRQPDLLNRRFDQDQRTPLHDAVSRDDLEFVRFLLERGADPTLEDGAYHSTPLGWARHFGHSAVIPLLEAHTPAD